VLGKEDEGRGSIGGWYGELRLPLSQISGSASVASVYTCNQWLNSAGTGRNGVPPPEIAVPPPKAVVPPPGNDVPSPTGGKSLKLLPPEVRF